MRIIRVFPRRTSHTPQDDLAFIGPPPIRVPTADEVHVSVSFTWDIPEGERLVKLWRAFYSTVLIGGPAIGPPGEGFEPGRYVKEGVTFTSRGCDHNCPWCLVSKVEGKLRLLSPIPPGYIVQDNNFLQCPPEHRRAVYAMLDEQPRAAVFSGGLESTLVDDEVAAELRDIRIKEVFLAADTEASLRPLERAVARLSFLPRRKLRCFVLMAYGGESIEAAERRVRAVWEIGCMPFAILYQPPDEYIQYSADWKALARSWCRPAAMVAEMRKGA